MAPRKKRPVPPTRADRVWAVIGPYIKPALAGAAIAAACHLLPVDWRVPCDILSRFLGKI